MPVCDATFPNGDFSDASGLLGNSVNPPTDKSTGDGSHDGFILGIVVGIIIISILRDQS